MTLQQEVVVTEPTTAQAWIHLQSGPIEPVEVQIHFCGASFEEVAQVLMGDVSPKKVAFIVFGHIQPELEIAGMVIDCQELSPVFEFGHELIHL